MDGFRVIAGNAVAAVVEGGEIELADGIAVLGGGKIPVEGFGEIFGDALAVVVERSEIIFRGRVMDARRGFVILKGESVILGNELAVFVEIAKIEFGVGIILRDGSAEIVEGGCECRRAKDCERG